MKLAWLDIEGHRTFITTAFVQVMSAIFMSVDKMTASQWIEVSSIVLAIYGTKSVAETVAKRGQSGNPDN
jgi:hypothetical protein